ncbi:hypothetical protein KASHIRA_01340 [Serratia phage vB_SmaM-Kashira]|nr:hypothetical protein [Acinetobacter phage ABPH49]URC22708.1 hypothetical protein KASHIRA_01340 [Serratia phage vB_SmaM-Kashira]
MREVGLSAGIDAPVIQFFYRNWRGECGYRKIKGTPQFWYGTSQYHKGAQWFIKAYDADKDDVRDFAVKDIIEFV